MSEQVTPIEWVRVDYICDKCKTGIMVATQYVICTNPPRYPHVCNQCKAEQVFEVMYPHNRDLFIESKEAKP